MSNDSFVPGKYHITELKFEIFISLRTWNPVIEKPKFWRWTTLRLDGGNYQEIIESLQADKSRDSNVQQICVSLQEELG